jgi:hypothetical protein
MENNNSIEKAYELIEQYEFAELSEADKLYVLSVMTESQYAEMRRTIDNVKLVLENDIEPIIRIPQKLKQPEDSKIRRLFNFQFKLYQVAASIAILITTFLIIQYSRENSTNQLIAKTDTIYVQHSDTLYTKVYDTIEVIREIERHPQNISQLKKTNLIVQSIKKSDCSNELCPNEIENITTMNTRNTISSDSILKEMLLRLN